MLSLGCVEASATTIPRSLWWPLLFAAIAPSVPRQRFNSARASWQTADSRRVFLELAMAGHKLHEVRPEPLNRPLMAVTRKQQPAAWYCRKDCAARRGSVGWQCCRSAYGSLAHGDACVSRNVHFALGLSAGVCGMRDAVPLPEQNLPTVSPSRLVAARLPVWP